MSTTKLYIRHLLISLTVLFLLVNILFLSRNFIQNVLNDPSKYLKSDISLVDAHFTIVFLILTVVIVLISYITYLLLTYKTRFDLEILGATTSLISSKEQFKSLYEGAPVPYLMLDKDGNIHDPNKATLRFFKVLPEEIIEKNLFSYISGENREEAERFFQYYKSHLPINRSEVEMVTKSGDIRTVQLSVFEMKNPGSFSSTGLAMIFDVTEQKMLDKAKTEFVSLASHQLRSPLATTKWLTEMLLSPDMGDISPKQQEYIGKLHQANEDMIDLVDALLNVSRIEMGSLAVDMKSVNIEELSDSVIDELSLLAQQRGVTIIKQYNGFLQDVKTDPKLLRIVIQNIVSNAVKYTGNGGTVSVVFEEFAGEKKIIISDTGLGIPKEQQDRIFTKLFRADNVRKSSESQGTGLGLYLVKSMISSINGSISFVSEENKGSTFTITL